MSTPATKAAPAAAAPAKATPAPAFSFKNLSIKDADLPTTRVSAEDNPFIPALQASMAGVDKTKDDWKGAGKSTDPMPASAAPGAERMIRQAAESLKVGSTIRFRTASGKLAVIESVGGKKNETTGRMTGGTPTLYVDGAAYTGADVVCYFAAKAPRKTKKATTAAPPAGQTATPATPAGTPGQ